MTFKQAAVVASVLSLAVGMAGCAAQGAGSSSQTTSTVRAKFPEPIDLANARAECLNKLGWSVTVDHEGAIHAEMPSSKDAEYRSDDNACLNSLGIDPDAPTPTALVERDFSLFRKGAECLRQSGWEISQAPSLQVFRDTYETDPWFPWNEVPQGQLSEAIKSCPVPKPFY